jgi:hypothetical protein
MDLLNLSYIYIYLFILFYFILCTYSFFSSLFRYGSRMFSINFLNGQKLVWSMTWKKIRETLNIFFCVCGYKSVQTRSARRVAKGQDQKNEALIPNETDKVRSHKNYPKYLEYNKSIHIGL